jgi:hypothetical protein
MSTKDWRSSSGTSMVAAMAWISSRSSGTQPDSKAYHREISMPVSRAAASMVRFRRGAPALDEEGQGGGGLEARILRERVVHFLTHVLIIDAGSSPPPGRIRHL